MQLPHLGTLFVLLSLAPIPAQTWSRRAPQGVHPSGNYRLSVAYNPLSQKVMAFGHNRKSETWEWDGAQWKVVATTGPSGSMSHRLAFDRKRNVMVFVGSIGNSFSFQTWEWNGRGWAKRTTRTSPPPREWFSVTYDTKRNVVVLYGGRWGLLEKSDTWEYDGTDWKLRATGGPPLRFQQNMVFDRARGETVLYGGYWDVGGNQSISYGDKWFWNGTIWRELVNIPGPQGRASAAMAYDSHRKRVVLYGGFRRNSPSATYHDTWEWDGTKWQQISAKNTPRLGAQGSMAYDEKRGVVVWTGGITPQTWEYQNAPTVQAAFTSYGSGCKGSAGVPLLAARTGQLPRIGTSFTVDITRLPRTAFARVFGVVSATDKNWAGIPLPLDLRVIGMPGCQLLAGLELPLTNLPISSQTASWTLSIPNNTQILGGKFFMQGIVFEPGINSFGAVTSNGGAGKIGL